MHLGRFHNTLWDIEDFLKQAKLPELLESCSAALEAYGTGKTEAQMQDFRKRFEDLLTASTDLTPDLLRPYAQDVITEMAIENLLPPLLPARLNEILRAGGFDHAGIVTDLRAEAKKLTSLAANIKKITSAFDDLNVEYDFVSGDEAEVGVMLPKSIVGETIPELIAEFGKLGKLFRAINELTGAVDYDPKIRTISSSAWQIFLDLSPEQIAVWIMAVERIIGLFKNNLEIKALQQALVAKQMPQDITERIEEEINARVAGSLESLADEIVADHSKVEDTNRLHEIRIQLRQGLRHLARRMNQGTQVEINVAIPTEPKDPPATPEGMEPDQELVARIAAQRARIGELRALNMRAVEASHSTLSISAEPQALLKYFDAQIAEEEALAASPQKGNVAIPPSSSET